MKNSLDKQIHLDFLTNKEDKKMRSLKEKISRFNKNVNKCEEFVLKKGDNKVDYYWCKEINNNCCYKNCPKINKSLKNLNKN